MLHPRNWPLVAFPHGGACSPVPLAYVSFAAVRPPLASGPRSAVNLVASKSWPFFGGTWSALSARVRVSQAFFP